MLIWHGGGLDRLPMAQPPLSIQSELEKVATQEGRRNSDQIEQELVTERYLPLSWS